METAAGSFAPGKKQDLFPGAACVPVSAGGAGWAEQEAVQVESEADLDGRMLCEQVGADAGMWAGPVLGGGGEPVAFPRSGNPRGERGGRRRAVSRGSGTDRGGIFRGAEMGGAAGNCCWWGELPGGVQGSPGRSDVATRRSYSA